MWLYNHSMWKSSSKLSPYRPEIKLFLFNCLDLLLQSFHSRKAQLLLGSRRPHGLWVNVSGWEKLCSPSRYAMFYAINTWRSAREKCGILNNKAPCLPRRNSTTEITPGRKQIFYVLIWKFYARMSVCISAHRDCWLEGKTAAALFMYKSDRASMFYDCFRLCSDMIVGRLSR
jgi:hypothetical protein